jgi:lysyl-tRNA synthetase class 2
MEQKNPQAPIKDANQEYKDRLQKLKDLEADGKIVYKDKYDRSHLVKDIIDTDQKSLRDTEEIIKKPKTDISIAGRLVSFRQHGRLSFANLQDSSGKMQICFMENVLGKDQYKFLKKTDVADFLGVKGELFITKHGELTLLVAEYELLSKALRPLPEKFHGLKDQETLYRQRYLDLIMNPDTKKRFEFRSAFIRYLREFYWKNGFKEVETPVLASSASGALAKPFMTHHDALDHDFYLRIAAGETYQKELVASGFDKIFELGRVFRNEGMDPSHLQEFTMNEFYHAYWNYKDAMKFTEEMFEYLLTNTIGTMEVEIADREGVKKKVNFKGPWKKISMLDAIKEESGIDINKYETAEDLLKVIKEKKIQIEDAEKLGRGNLIDHLYKKVARPNMTGPVFLIQHPTDLSPLSRRNDENPMIVDRFQVVVMGQQQADAFSEQSLAKAGGDEEAHSKDDDFVLAMEHGFPPMTGWGMGIDRIVALLTNQDNLKDVVFFPLLKPQE